MSESIADNYVKAYVSYDVQREGGRCEPFMMKTEPVFEREVNVDIVAAICIRC